MRLYLLALDPTDSVSEGFLPAAEALGVDVTILTDRPEPHRHRHPGVRVVGCDVRDAAAVITAISTRHPADAVFSDSDQLQPQTALAADYFGLPGKDWRAALRVADKAQMRRHLAAAGVDAVRAWELGPTDNPARFAEEAVPYPCIVKPREGVAGEDVSLVRGYEELLLRCKQIRSRKPSTALVVEEYLPGELYTLETLGDGDRLHVLGGFHTILSPPPRFVALRHTFVPAHLESVVAQVLAQLRALGVGFGSCHTEFVVSEGRARLIEVNYRTVGDQCDLLLAQLLGIPLFEHILRTHLGRPLPRDLHPHAGRAGRVDHICATASGILTAAPEPVDAMIDGVALTYRPLRSLGERHELHGTNRDYVGVLRALGGDTARVNQVADRFLAEQRWEITP